MNKIFAKVSLFLSAYIGRYYFIEVEEKQKEFGQVGLRKYRLVIRAMTTRSAITAAQRYTLQLKQRDQRDYEVALIQKV